MIQDPPLPFPLVELKGLFDIAQNPDQVAWQTFREGVDIYRLYGDGISGPTAALLRFRQASQVPTHMHEGYEHILVLAGSQQDHKGRIEAGTLRIHPPGTSHSVTSDAGCIVLAIYEKPVRFLEEFPKSSTPKAQTE
ncbi:MAG: cupin domain-containing protein [Verrucomicrobium sp.]|nr:cupin domain-containing protein [Verrucomicrobium sp.]